MVRTTLSTGVSEPSTALTCTSGACSTTVEYAYMKLPAIMSSAPESTTHSCGASCAAHLRSLEFDASSPTCGTSVCNGADIAENAR